MSPFRAAASTLICGLVAALLSTTLVVSEGIRPEVLVTFRDLNIPARQSISPVPSLEPEEPVQIAQGHSPGRLDGPRRTGNQAPTRTATPPSLRRLDPPTAHPHPEHGPLLLPPDPDHLTTPDKPKRTAREQGAREQAPDQQHIDQQPSDNPPLPPTDSENQTPRPQVRETPTVVSQAPPLAPQPITITITNPLQVFTPPQGPAPTPVLPPPPSLDPQLQLRLERMQEQLLEIARQQLASDRQALVWQMQTEARLLEAQRTAVSAETPAESPAPVPSPVQEETPASEPIQQPAIIPGQQSASGPELSPAPPLLREEVPAEETPRAETLEQNTPATLPPPAENETEPPSIPETTLPESSASTAAPEAEPELEASASPVHIEREADSPDSNPTYTIHAVGIDVRDMLEELASVAELNLCLSPQVSGLFSLSARQMTATELLQVAVRSHHLHLETSDKLTIVRTEAEAQALARTREKPITRIFRPQTARAQDLLAAVQPLLSPAPLGFASVSQDTLIVQETPAAMDRLGRLISELDASPRQLLLEAIVLQIPSDDTQALGIVRESAASAAASSPGDLTGGILTSDLSGFLNQLRQRPGVTIQAAPRWRVLDRHSSEVLIGSRENAAGSPSTIKEVTPLRPEQVAGLKLRVRPSCLGNNQVRLEIDPQFGTRHLDPTTGAPLVTQAGIQTSLQIPLGQTVLLSGLLEEHRVAPIIPPKPEAPPVQPRKKRWWPITTTESQPIPQPPKRFEMVILITAWLIPGAESTPLPAGSTVNRLPASAQTKSLAAKTPAQPGGITPASHELRVSSARLTPFQQRQQAKHYYEQARAEFDRRDYSAAREHLRLSLHYNPEDLLARQLAQILQRTTSTASPSVQSVERAAKPSSTGGRR